MPDAQIGEIIAGNNHEGNHSNQLSYPDGILLDKNGTLFICDSGNKRIQRWFQNDTEGFTILQNTSCWGLAMDHAGSLYIGARINESHVLKWPSGQVVAGGNGKGSALNQLSDAPELFVDQDQSVYIADGDTDRIVKWTRGATDGIVVADGNGRGNASNQFNGPTSVIIDQMGTLYVTDYHNQRVTRWFNGSNTGITIVGGRGDGNRPDQLRFPTDLKFDRDGNLWVADYINNRIQMFTIDKSSCQNGFK